MIRFREHGPADSPQIDTPSSTTAICPGCNEPIRVSHSGTPLDLCRCILDAREAYEDDQRKQRAPL